MGTKWQWREYPKEQRAKFRKLKHKILLHYRRYITLQRPEVEEFLGLEIPEFWARYVKETEGELKPWPSLKRIQIKHRDPIPEQAKGNRELCRPFLNHLNLVLYVSEKAITKVPKKLQELSTREQAKAYLKNMVLLNRTNTLLQCNMANFPFEIDKLRGDFIPRTRIRQHLSLFYPDFARNNVTFNQIYNRLQDLGAVPARPRNIDGLKYVVLLYEN